MIAKNECKHIHTIKSGRKMYTDGFYQMMRCYDCGTVFKGNKVKE